MEEQLRWFLPDENSFVTDKSFYLLHADMDGDNWLSANI